MHASLSSGLASTPMSRRLYEEFISASHSAEKRRPQSAPFTRRAAPVAQTLRPVQETPPVRALPPPEPRRDEGAEQAHEEVLRSHHAYCCDAVVALWSELGFKSTAERYHGWASPSPSVVLTKPTPMGLRDLHRSLVELVDRLAPDCPPLLLDKQHFAGLFGAAAVSPPTRSATVRRIVMHINKKMAAEEQRAAGGASGRDALALTPSPARPMSATSHAAGSPLHHLRRVQPQQEMSDISVHSGHSHHHGDPHALTWSPPKAVTKDQGTSMSVAGTPLSAALAVPAPSPLQQLPPVRQLEPLFIKRPPQSRAEALAAEWKRTSARACRDEAEDREVLEALEETLREKVVKLITKDHDRLLALQAFTDARKAPIPSPQPALPKEVGSGLPRDGAGVTLESDRETGEGAPVAGSADAAEVLVRPPSPALRSPIRERHDEEIAARAMHEGLLLGEEDSRLAIVAKERTVRLLAVSIFSTVVEETMARCEIADDLEVRHRNDISFKMQYAGMQLFPEERAVVTEAYLERYQVECEEAQEFRAIAKWSESLLSDLVLCAVEDTAATIIQGGFRRHRHRSPSPPRERGQSRQAAAEEQRVEADYASRVIQRRARTYLASKEVKQRRSKSAERLAQAHPSNEGGAGAFETSSNGHTEASSEKSVKQQTEAAITIQKHERGRQARREAGRRRRWKQTETVCQVRDEAATRIQCMYRQTAARAEARLRRSQRRQRPSTECSSVAPSAAALAVSTGDAAGREESRPRSSRSLSHSQISSPSQHNRGLRISSVVQQARANAVAEFLESMERIKADESDLRCLVEEDEQFGRCESECLWPLRFPLPLVEHAQPQEHRLLLKEEHAAFSLLLENERTEMVSAIERAATSHLRRASSDDARLTTSLNATSEAEQDRRSVLISDEAQQVQCILSAAAQGAS